ncbi:MAG: GTP-binding protein [Candidatus Rehaiarchaeum fermentans]|nr:GTP-binding protein [Candidatus Rehaiarchaeum fermentans]
MKNLTIAVIGPYGSGKTSIVEQLKQKEGLESEDIVVRSFKQRDTLVNLVDVPGGLDTPEIAIATLSFSNAFMLVIGADNPITYQLGEFIGILDNMKFNKGIICLNKIDSADKEVAIKKLSSLLKGTSLENVEIFPMSAFDPQNIADLREKLISIEVEDKSNYPAVFTVDSGFEWSKGAVALGTLLRGKIEVHKKLIICPEPLTKELEVLSIQVNQEDQKELIGNSRAGIGLKDIYPWYLNRGVELREEGKYKDVKEGKIKIELSKLYKNKIEEESEITLINHWQNVNVKLSNIKIENNILNADFSADKNIAFDENDVILAINKDLPIRMFRILGRAYIY